MVPSRLGVVPLYDFEGVTNLVGLQEDTVAFSNTTQPKHDVHTNFELELFLLLISCLNLLSCFLLQTYFLRRVYTNGENNFPYSKRASGEWTRVRQVTQKDLNVVLKMEHGVLLIHTNGN